MSDVDIHYAQRLGDMFCNIDRLPEGARVTVIVENECVFGDGCDTFIIATTYPDEGYLAAILHDIAGRFPE